MSDHSRTHCVHCGAVHQNEIPLETVLFVGGKCNWGIRGNFQHANLICLHNSCCVVLTVVDVEHVADVCNDCRNLGRSGNKKVTLGLD